MKRIIYVDGSCIPGSNMVSYAAVCNKSRERVEVDWGFVENKWKTIRRLSIVAELHAILFGYKKFHGGGCLVVCSDCKGLVDNLNRGKSKGFCEGDGQKARKIIRLIECQKLMVIWKRGHQKQTNPLNHIVDIASYDILNQYR